MHEKSIPFLLYGGDYNPDQWNREVITEDIKLFKEAGVNLVTLPVFSWARIEKEEGVYNFGWLDDVLGKLWENQIYVCLATTTAAQPAWLSGKYPEVLPVDIEGRKRTHGMRMFFCVNSYKYREKAAAITRQMAERYGKYPGLIAWHVSNEYGTYCYCDNCEKKFRKWLSLRYKTIECLNERWNTTFWGRIVYDFDEIRLPTKMNDDYRFNPAVQLDYMRFMTDSTLECYLNEADILKEYTPAIPIFSNISGFIKKLDQFKLAAYMDYAGWDNYPGPRDESSFPALKHDIMRALKNGKPYLVAEQSPNQQNWQPYNKLKKPGEMRLIAYQGMAHGADSSLFFQLRQSIAGQEKFHGALISHGGSNDTRIFKEFSALGKELKKLNSCFLGSRIRSDVGILFDWENWWALELASGPSADMDYLEQVHTYYKPFYKQNVPVDIINLKKELSKYKIIVAPLLYMIKDEIDKKLAEFVMAGGILITTYLTGMADDNDRCVFGAYPGPLREVLGLTVEETDALYPDESNTIRTNKNESYQCGFLCDIIKPETAEVIGEYGEDFYKKTPAITCNKYGKGKAYYIGSQLEDDFLDKFVGRICREQKVAAVLETDGNVEVTLREGESGSYYFILNHNKKAAFVQLGSRKYQNLLTNETVEGLYKLSHFDVAILKELNYSSVNQES